MKNAADFRGVVETRIASATYVAAIAMDTKRWFVLATASVADQCGRFSTATIWHALKHCKPESKIRDCFLYE
jgi:hypothetical protein